MATQIKKLLVVGSGRMGEIRMKASRIIPNIQLCGVVDENLENAKKFGQQYQIPYASSIKSFIKTEGAPDGIWLTTPTATHEKLIEYAASQCIPVATEKPVAMDAITTEKCYKLCQDANIALFCGFQRRVDPHYQGITQHLRNGNIGNIQSMHSIFRDHPIPAIEFLLCGGDLFHDCGVHDIDFARSLMDGYEIKTVYAFGHSFNDKLREHNVLDLVNGLLQFENNVMYSMEVGRTATYGYDQRFEVFGSYGCVKSNNVHENYCSLESMNGISNTCYQYSFPQRYETAFRIEMERFLNVLNGEEKPFVSCIDACRATQVAEACRLSIVHKVSVDIEYDRDVASKCKYIFSDKQMTLDN